MINSPLKEIIRSEAIIAEKTGKLTPKQLAIIYENKWFHLLVPEQYGGMEMDLPSFALFMEELAIVDGSFAWNVNLGAGANMFAGYMSNNVAETIFRDPKACIAGSGAASGTATKAGDHYIIQGYWKYASGSAHANFFSLNAKILNEEGEDTGIFSSFIVPVHDVQNLNTWKTTGLRATASNDFKVESKKVPLGYSFDLQKPSPTNNGVLYRFPFQILAEINMLVMSTGLAKRFLELAKEIAEQKKKIKGGEVELVENWSYKNSWEKHEGEFIQDRDKVFSSLSNLWNKANQRDSISTEEQVSFTHEVLRCAESSRKLVDVLYPFMGMHTVFESSEINRVWRDFKVASQHYLISPVHFV
ncbi:MAG TPA: acyl-CoA dehydrogenase family protein [Sphingobacteriaceae bacterium]|nr:acyl-CoA dehydrogenase family protein [Sphingobacteriaceae bacterium]